jgi:hypothetical protein
VVDTGSYGSVLRAATKTLPLQHVSVGRVSRTREVTSTRLSLSIGVGGGGERGESSAGYLAPGKPLAGGKAKKLGQ